MNEGSDKVQKVKNSDVIKRTLFSLIYVARSKTSKDYAWSIVKRLLVELKANHDFLKYIYIGEIENLKDNIDDITVFPHTCFKCINNILNCFANFFWFHMVKIG